MADKSVQRYTEGALKSSLALDRETYKAIKHMDKVELSNYLESIYRKAYEAGKADKAKEMHK